MSDISQTGAIQAKPSQQGPYAMGHSDRERQRLMRQGAILREITASTFRAAGIGPGMRVLDIGSGVGDVALLAADMVGPTGSVVGLNRDADSIAWSIHRVAEASRNNIRFQATELDQFTDATPFDALVGRFILMYLPQPEVTLRKLSVLLRSGGVVAFLEPDLSVEASLRPEVPLFRQCERWFEEALRRSGARIDMGMRLYQTYREAGLTNAASQVSHLSGCGVQPGLGAYYGETIRSILPKLEEYGIATQDEVQIDTLAERLESEGRAVDPQWVSNRYIGAWATKP